MRAKPTADPSAPTSGDHGDLPSRSRRPRLERALVSMAIVAVLAIAILAWGATQDGDGASIVRALVRQLVRALF